LGVDQYLYLYLIYLPVVTAVSDLGTTEKPLAACAKLLNVGAPQALKSADYCFGSSFNTHACLSQL